MPHGLPHRARTGIAAGLTLAFVVLAAAPALADQTRQNEWWVRTLHVANAWQITRGSGVTVAVLDTGVDASQPDLTGSVTTGPDYTNSGRKAGGQFWGINGTEIASLIAGHGHGAGQANGIMGIAPAAKILSLRVTLESNDPLLANQAIATALPDAIAHGIRWAVRHDATVIDLPLDPVTTPGAPGSGGSPAERAAVAYALARHVVLVAPAGDGGAGTNPVNYPAAYHGVIAVGAFDRHFVKAPFTSHQPYVTVTAAGAGVTVASPSSVFAANPSKAYTQLNSTGAASAIVAGIVALIRAQFPGLTPAQVTRALTTSTRFRPHGGRANGSGFGTVDAYRALTAAAGIAESVSQAAASGAAQAPPTPPAVHSSPIHRNITHRLIIDAAIAGAVFLFLLIFIFAVKAWRRRRARLARLAQVRAAARVQARKAGPAMAKKGTAAGPGAPATLGSAAAGTKTEAAPPLEPAGFIPAPLGQSIPGSGSPSVAGSASSGFAGSVSTGFTGSSGFTGSASTGFTGSSSGFTGSASTGLTGSASSKFAGSSSLTGPASPGFTGSASSGPAGSASSGPAGSASSGPAGSASSGFAAGDPTVPDPGGLPRLGAAGAPSRPGTPPAADPAPQADLVPPSDLASSASLDRAGKAGAGTPPWAAMQSQPRAPAGEGASAAIPESAFPAPAAPAAPAAANEPGHGTESTSGPASATAPPHRLAGWRAPAAVHRPSPARAAQVSGQPPWDPAPQPDSELPWAQTPAPPRRVAGSLPKREQRPALPSWDALAEEAWPGGPRAAALHPPVPTSADQAPRPGARPGGPVPLGGSAGAPAAGAPPARRPLSAAGLMPPQAESPEQKRPAEQRPDYGWNPDPGVEPFPAARSEPASSAVGGADQGADGPGSSPAGQPTGQPARSTASQPAGSPSQPGGSPASQPTGSPASHVGNRLPRRLGAAPLRYQGPLPGQPGTDSGRFPDADRPSFPPAPRPATESGAAGTWPTSAEPPAPRPATESGAAGTWPASAEPPAPRPATESGAAGTWPASAEPPANKPATGSPQSATGSPPGDSTDSFLAVPPAPVGGAGQAGSGPATPAPASGPATPAAASGPPDASAGTAGPPGDGSESFPAADRGAEQRSFPRSLPGDGSESFPRVRPQPDEDAFRLFPPMRGTDNQPPAPPASEGQD